MNAYLSPDGSREPVLQNIIAGMKKPYKRILRGLLVVVALIVLLFTGYYLKARSIIKAMTPTETRQINGDIFSIRDSFTNMYLIKEGEQYIAIDAGNSPDNLLKELKKLNIEKEKIEAIFLTHTDGDHVAGIRLFSKAGVFLSKAEEQLINGKKARFFLFGNKLDTKKYSLMDDRQILTVGNTKIQGFLSPGHTPGSMCYLVNDRYLFTGDALRLNHGKVDRFEEFLNMDTKTAIRSIGNIIRIPGIVCIFTAHYGYTTDVKNAVKDWK